MTKNTYVYHSSRDFWMRAGQVEKAIEKSCSFVWVIRGETFRDATTAEAITMRNEQASKREPLEFAELPGIVYRPTERDIAAHRNELKLAAEANRFAAAVKGE